MSNAEPEIRPELGPSHEFTTVQITEGTRKILLDKAENWSDALGSVPGSIEHGDGNTAGRVGELLFQEVFGGEIMDHYEYDIWYEGLTVDVKTKRRTVPPQPHYEASIADWNPSQSCDLYYFISLLGESAEQPYSKAWLCGYIQPDEYHEQATYHEQGEHDPDNNFVFQADCYNLPYEELNRRADIESAIQI